MTCLENEEATPGWSIMTVGVVSTFVSGRLNLARCPVTPPEDDMEDGVQRRGWETQPARFPGDILQ
eukprot:7478777-Heterocapsa_arctica.AAC.1